MLREPVLEVAAPWAAGRLSSTGAKAKLRGRMLWLSVQVCIHLHLCIALLWCPGDAQGT